MIMRPSRLRPLLALLALGALPAAPLVAQNAQQAPTVIECAGTAETVSTDTETTFTFRDKVVVTGTNLKLTCDFLQVIVRRKADPAATIGKMERFKSLLATGNVRILQEDREAVCGRAEVLPEQDKITLTENPVVKDLGNGGTVTGPVISLHRGQRRAVIEGGTTIVLPPVKDLGFDQDKPADAPKQP